MIWTNEMWESDPFAEVRRLQREMNRLFTGFGAARESFPAVNIWSAPDRAVVKAEVPGVDPKDIEISVQHDLLTLQGERKEPALSDDAVCHRAERGQGRFLRTVRLPFEVESGKVSAQAVNGILTVTLPRAEASKPKRIPIQAG